MRFYKDDKERFSDIHRTMVRIARWTKPKEGAKILDVLTGYADFPIEIAKIMKSGKIVGTELFDKEVRIARLNAKKAGVNKILEIKRADIRHTSWPPDSFDVAINFIGWEDLMPLSGEKSVVEVFREVYRLLKKGGTFIVIFIPEIEPRNNLERLDLKISNNMWLGQKGVIYKPESFFKKKLIQAGFSIEKRKTWKTSGKHLTAKQARDKLEWVFKDYNRSVFKNLGIVPRNPNQLWKYFGEHIEKFGILEKRSYFVAFKCRK